MVVSMNVSEWNLFKRFVRKMTERRQLQQNKPVEAHVLVILKGVHLNSDLLFVPALPNRFASGLPLLLWLHQNQLHQASPDVNERQRAPTTNFSTSTYLHPPTDVKYDSTPTAQLQTCFPFCTDPLHSHSEGAHTSLRHPHPVNGK